MPSGLYARLCHKFLVYKCVGLATKLIHTLKVYVCVWVHMYVYCLWFSTEKTSQFLVIFHMRSTTEEKFGDLLANHRHIILLSFMQTNQSCQINVHCTLVF